MAATDKLQGTCSVCLRPMQLYGEFPIRHGFSAVGVRHGQHSGWHTGPCAGTQFPHLGISDEGTRWARVRAQERLRNVEEELVRLARHPDLTWYPRKFASQLPDLSKPVTFRHEEKEEWSSDGRPTYAREHKRLVTAQESLQKELEKTIETYDKVIETWAPEKYPTTGAAKKVETVHMATPRKNNRGEEWTGVLCRFTKQGLASNRLSKTTDPSKVTCRRCRAALGLPPL